jgi:uncharacterized repeat protein (TIGR01451 family)
LFFSRLLWPENDCLLPYLLKDIFIVRMPMKTKRTFQHALICICLTTFLVLFPLLRSANALIKCTGDGYKITAGGNAIVYRVDPENPIPSIMLSGVNINSDAFGYSLQHGLFFAVDNNTHQLNSIDENGNVHQVTVSGLPQGAQLGPIRLDVSYDGYVYATESTNGDRQLYRLKLNANGDSATYQNTILVTVNLGTDIAIHPTNGHIFTISRVPSKIYEYAITGGSPVNTYIVDYSTTSPPPTNSQEGAQWFDSKGRMYGWMNLISSDGNYHLYRYTFSGTKAIAEDLGSAGNIIGTGDGAACPAGIDFKKEVNRSIATPGDLLEFTFTIENYYQYAIDFTLDDTLAAGLTVVPGSFQYSGAIIGTPIENISAGIPQAIQITGITIPGSTAAPEGGKTGVVKVTVKVPYDQPVGIVKNQAFLGNLPPVFPDTVPSTLVTVDIHKKFPWPLFTPAITRPCPPIPEYCYMVADGDNEYSTNSPLLKYTFATDRLELLNRLGVSNVEAIVLSPDGQTIYSADNGVFGRIDPNPGLTNSFIPINVNSQNTGMARGAMGVVPIQDIDGLSIDPITNILYATNRLNSLFDLLIQLNPTTGKIILNAFGKGVDYLVIDTASVGASDIDDIAIDSDGTLYAVAGNSGGGGNDHLVVIDKLTGAITDMGPLHLTNEKIQDMEGLTLYNRSTLYGTTGLEFGSYGTSNTLYKIDKISGETTAVKNLDQDFNGYIPSDFEAISCFPVCK